MDHRIHNQQISLNSLGTTPSPGVDEIHSSSAFWTWILYTLLQRLLHVTGMKYVDAITDSKAAPEKNLYTNPVEYVQ